MASEDVWSLCPINMSPPDSDIHQENMKLLLQKEFYKFQVEEFKQEKAMLVNEINLLERLMNERSAETQASQYRLAAR